MSVKPMEFDSNLWHELLLLEASLRKSKKKVSRSIIEEKFLLSDRTANAYLFALNNRNNLTSNLSEDKKIRELSSKLKTALKSISQMQELLTLEEARADFAIGLAETFEESKELPVFEIPKFKPSESEQTVATIFSDVHVEEKVDKEMLLGINEYNPEIAKVRIQRYFQRLLWKVNKDRDAGYKINNLFFQVLGDLITGYIHKELISSNFMSPTEALVTIQNLLLGGLQFLYEEGKFEKIIIVMIPGNHGRNTDKLYHADSYKHSYEYMMYKQLQGMIEQGMTRIDPNKVLINVPKSTYAYTKIYDKVYRSSHGNHFKYLGGVGGLYIPLMRHLLRTYQQKSFDRAYFGHWHTCFSLPECGSNGSVIGINPYGFDSGFNPQSPRQLYELIDSKKGVTDFSPILLDDF